MTNTSNTTDLVIAARAVELSSAIVGKGVRTLTATGGPDTQQVLAYDLAHAGAAVETARSMLDYGAKGELESTLTCAFVADMVHDLVSRLIGREKLWGVDPSTLAESHDFVEKYRDPNLLASLATKPGKKHLDDDNEMVQDTFRSFATKVVAPHAEHVHRENLDVPEEIISGLAEIGAFGLSIPVEYGGFSEGGDGEYMASCIATEELSRASLGIGGSLITRPEILTRALVKGGTEAQKHEWLPKLATAEVMVAVAVTEPDYGSDVATWCTFAARANVLMLLARTDPDRTKSHKGLSVLIVPKPRGDAHGFVFNQPSGGRMEGRPIDTIGYRGMHSYEIALENWWVPADHLIGETAGLGKGFYYQMEGFENGRLQTAARAVGVMQAAYEAACDYSQNRKTFGNNIAEYQLTQVKLGRMAVVIQGSRQFSYAVAKMMGKGEGAMEASMVKAYVCKAAEWVTREAMQIHGGYGYAEEYSVSRLFVDARVLSIFEGADETLCLKVIARRMVETAKAS
ncbi:MAG: acyl-CoA/acyl-ACP dehydrogenase [Actinobacteria bacterium]|nr:acyl-CoA/acyl-ACP dehydrogenase [Actinomycetota bacterium]